MEQVEGSKAEGKKVCIAKLFPLLAAGPQATRESRDGIKPAGGVIPPEGPLHTDPRPPLVKGHFQPLLPGPVNTQADSFYCWTARKWQVFALRSLDFQSGRFKGTYTRDSRTRLRVVVFFISMGTAEVWWVIRGG